MNTTLATRPRSLAVEPLENRLLAALPVAELQRWRPHLEPVSLAAGAALSRGGDLAGDVYFPTTASISLMHTTRDGNSLEVVAVGREGMVGLQTVMGGGAALGGAVVRVSGQAFRVSKDWLHSEFHHCPAVMRLMLGYAQTVMTHTAQLAVCNTHHSLEQRLCRCLLSNLDHGHGASLKLTHEALSYMLGVRREGVTCVALKLPRAGVIDYARGRVDVVDRHALEERSCECYRVVKSAYDRLLPGATPFTGLVPSRVEARCAVPAWATSVGNAGHRRGHVETGAIAG